MSNATQSNPYINQILLHYSKALLKSCTKYQIQNRETPSNEFIIDQSLQYFQTRLDEYRHKEARRIDMQHLIDLYQYLNDPMSDRRVNEKILSDFKFRKESIDVIVKYFPSVKEDGAQIDFSKVFALCLLLSSDASIDDLLHNTFRLFSCSGQRKVACALLKKCLDWIEPLIQNFQHRMLYDCFLTEMEELSGMISMEQLDDVMKVAKQQAEEMEDD